MMNCKNKIMNQVFTKITVAKLFWSNYMKEMIYLPERKMIDRMNQ